MGVSECKEEERREETLFPLAPSPHVSDSPADDLWRALSRGVIGRHVASKCGNESIRVGTDRKDPQTCVDGNFPTAAEGKQALFATWREKDGARNGAGRVVSHGRNHPVKEPHLMLITPRFPESSKEREKKKSKSEKGQLLGNGL